MRFEAKILSLNETKALQILHDDVAQLTEERDAAVGATETVEEKVALYPLLVALTCLYSSQLDPAAFLNSSQDFAGLKKPALDEIKPYNKDKNFRIPEVLANPH